MSEFTDAIKNESNTDTLRPRKEPLWKGPEVDGITFSLLSKFLSCKERFRVTMIDGLAPPSQFNHKLEYGNMWHVCEEHYDSENPNEWVIGLHKYATGLHKKYPIQGEQIDKWRMVCLRQFPIYLAYWQHKEEKDQESSELGDTLFSEKVFEIPYTLPSGRKILLRGKWDKVFYKRGGTNGKNVSLWIKENKTKGEVDETNILRQLKFDLQTMIYVIALQELYKQGDANFGKSKSVYTVKGVLYNVVRRPLSGGKYTIIRHKKTKNKPEESRHSYYNRLGALIQSDPQHFFKRWIIDIKQEDIDRFKRECLDPLLEDLYNWWERMTGSITPKENLVRGLHYRRPFGVWNQLDEAGFTDLDNYLDTGSTVGLALIDTLFPELAEEK